MNPFLIGIAIGAFLGLLIAENEKPSPDASLQNLDEKPEQPAERETSPLRENLVENAAVAPVFNSVTLDMLREIFHDGAHALRRREAVEMLKAALYFVPKTNAYRPLAPSRRFSAHFREDEHGWLHLSP